MITLPERIRQLQAGHVRRSGSWRPRARSKTHRKLLKGGPGGLRGRRRPRACPTERSWGVGSESNASLEGILGSHYRVGRPPLPPGKGFGGDFGVDEACRPRSGRRSTLGIGFVSFFQFLE